MKKIGKILLMCAMIAALTVCTVSAAYAAQEKEIGVQIGEKQLEFKTAKPEMIGNRVYVPVRSILEALGATVSYEDATQTASAVRGDTTVKFTVSQNKAVIIKGTAVQTITMDAAAYMQGDYMMVPARYAAQAFGCVVGWDSRENTVLIFDAEGLVRDGGYTYNLLGKLANTDRSGTYSFNGTYGFSYTDGYNDPAAVKGTLSGITDSKMANIAVSIDLSGMAAASTDPQTRLALSLLGIVKAKMIVNSADNTFYIQCPYLSTYMGIEQDAWISYKMTDGTADASGIQMPSIAELFKGYVSSPGLYSKSQLSDAVNSFKMLNRFISDNAYTKSGNTYTNKQTIDTGSGNMAVDISLTAPGNTITAYSVSMTMDTQDVSFKFSLTGDSSRIDMTLDLKGSDDEAMTASFNMTCSATDERPQTAPPAGSIIYDYNELVFDML